MSFLRYDQLEWEQQMTLIWKKNFVFRSQRVTIYSVLPFSKISFHHSRKKRKDSLETLSRNLCYVDIYRAPKSPGITSKKPWVSLKGISRLQVIFVLIWMKQTLIWLSLQRDGTGNGLYNIKDTFAERLQLQMSVLHQRICIFKDGLLSSYDGWAKQL